VKFKQIGLQKFILVLTAGIFIGWALAGKAAEQWNAKTSARVNLRRNPSLNGVILSTVPKGYNLRIIEKKKLWYKVDVEGEIHGKGWVYAEYVEEIFSKKAASESGMQTVMVELESEENEQGINPLDLPAKAMPEGKKENILNTPPPKKIPGAGEMAQSSIRSEFQSGEDKRNELRDAKNESNALSQAETPMAGKSVYIPPAQPTSSGFQQDALGISEKSFSGAIELGNASLHQKSLPGREKKPSGVVQETRPRISEKAMIDLRALAASVERSAIPLERKRPINRRESMGLFEITIKFLAIALSCLVLLFLYRARKKTSNHYDSLLQFQHNPNTREHREPDPVPLEVVNS
jgi:hypothetical protein